MSKRKYGLFFLLINEVYEKTIKQIAAITQKTCVALFSLWSLKKTFWWVEQMQIDRNTLKI